MSEIRKAPWDDEFILRMVEHQARGDLHPYTCANRGDGNHPEVNGDRGVLRPTPDGWVCDHCEYRQNWAHGGVLRPPIDWGSLLEAEFKRHATDAFQYGLYGTTSAAPAEPEEPLTMKKLEETMNRLELGIAISRGVKREPAHIAGGDRQRSVLAGVLHAPLGGLQIIVEKHWQKVGYLETVRKPAHPLIWWLVKWLGAPISWLHVEYQVPKLRDADPIKFGNKILCSPAQYAELKAAAKDSP